MRNGDVYLAADVRDAAHPVCNADVVVLGEFKLDAVREDLCLCFGSGGPEGVINEATGVLEFRKAGGGICDRKRQKTGLPSDTASCKMGLVVTCLKGP